MTAPPHIEPVAGPGSPAAPGDPSEELLEGRRRAAVSALVVHEAIRLEGEEELRRPLEAVAFSGLAAGLSMGFSFVAEGLLNAYLPAQQWAPLVIKLGYPVGFLIVILGRQHCSPRPP